MALRVYLDIPQFLGSTVTLLGGGGLGPTTDVDRFVVVKRIISYFMRHVHFDEDLDAPS